MKVMALFGSFKEKKSLENFTEKAKTAIILAQKEAEGLGHNFVGTESILLGIIAEDKGVAANLLKSLGITLKNARMEVEKTIGRGSDSVVGDIPFTHRANRVIEMSYNEAAKLSHEYVDTQHLLLALIEEGEGVSLRILENLGINSTQILNQLVTQIHSDIKYTKVKNNTPDIAYPNILIKSAIIDSIDSKVERLNTILAEAQKIIYEIGEIKGQIQHDVSYSLKNIDNIIDQLPNTSSAEQLGIKELLNQLKTIIENDIELKTEDKTEVLEQILNIALASQNPTEKQMKKSARTAVKIIIGTVAQRPPDSKLVKESKRILPEIVKFFKLR